MTAVYGVTKVHAASFIIYKQDIIGAILNFEELQIKHSTLK